MRWSRFIVVSSLALMVTAGVESGCGPEQVATPPNPPAAAQAPPSSLDRKVSWILRLEEQRMLRDPGVTPHPAAANRTLAPAATADLEALALDPDPGLRRRAVLAIGRVGLPDGMPALTSALADTDVNVRAQAAFAMGLIGAKAAVQPLEGALADPSAEVKGRAAEALGLIGDSTAAARIAETFASCPMTLAGMAPDDEEWPKSAEIEACRLAVFALVRLKNYDALARLTIDDQGQPAWRWWPIGFALSRIGDARAANALAALASTPGVTTAAFALRGLAQLGDRRAFAPAKDAASRLSNDIKLRVAGVRALGQIGGTPAADALLTILADRTTPRNLEIETVTALGRVKDPRAFDPLLDLATDSWPALRAAALDAAARIKPDDFVLVAPSVLGDKDWSVRAALAGALATLPPDRVRDAIEDLTADADARVRGPALRALAKIGAPDLDAKLVAALDAPDFAVRAAAAELIGQRKPEGGAARLTAAYARGASDATYSARVAALDGLAKYGGDDAKTVLRQALDDKDWPVRWKAAELLRSLGEPGAEPHVPAPLRQAPDFFESAALLHPKYSPHALIEMKTGTIEIELDVVNAPVTSAAFVELARAGFFNGLKIHRVVPGFVVQDGDPRGDGEGGPGFSIRDELSTVPFLRGTVGMALDFHDTGGSQFFITLSPQPHLDAKYTVFGRVVQGFDLLDQVAAWDVITRIRIWDGTSF